jgi:U3 small nucleolar ribonucleoprotein protein IMP4
MIVCHYLLGPMAYFMLSGAILRHDLEGGAAPMSEAYPRVVINNMQTKLRKCMGNVLKCLFPVPKPDTQRVVMFSNDGNYHVIPAPHILQEDNLGEPHGG